MFPRPVEVLHLGEFRLQVRYEDGVIAELDFSPMLRGEGLYAQLRNPPLFAAVRIDPESQSILWPNGVDVCPDVLYHVATGAPLPGTLEHPPAIRINVSYPPIAAAS